MLLTLPEMIPFESVTPFTIGTLIKWYLSLAFCGAMGALASAFCIERTKIKTITGILLGVVGYYIFKLATPK